MNKINYTVQYSSVINMLATELKRQGIPLAEDEELRYNIISESATQICYANNFTDIQECVDEIKQYIADSQQNYPNWFLTGEDK